MYGFYTDGVYIEPFDSTELNAAEKYAEELGFQIFTEKWVQPPKGDVIRLIDFAAKLRRAKGPFNDTSKEQ